MADKIALSGFCASRLWPITTNDKTTYATGTMDEFEGARNLTKDESRSEYTIPGDNIIYATGSELDYEDLEFEVNQLTLAQIAFMNGATYNESTKEYIAKKGDKPPEYAYAYAAPLLDGGYRMFKHYCCKTLKIKVDHTTVEQGKKDIQTYKITMRSTYRTADLRSVFIKDAETLDWLNTIDQLPVEPEGGGGGGG